MLTRQFWLGDSGVLVRALRTAAQTALAAIGVGTTNLFTADLKNVAALSFSAAFLSVLMSMDRSTTAAAAVADATAPAIAPIPASSVTDITSVPVVTAPSAHGCGESLR